MVNVMDFESEDKGGDKLEAIFARQRELMEKYHVIEAKNGLLQTEDVPVDLDDRFGQARIKDLTWRVVEELGEACNCLKQRPWKQSQVVTDQDHFYEELADAFHFFIELLLTVGIDADGCFDFYMRKSEVNKFRQRSNY